MIPKDKITKAEQKRKETQQWVQSLSDELNPEFIFCLTWNELLVKIANGEIDTKELAIKELENRGYDTNGKWVGFKKQQK